MNTVEINMIRNLNAGEQIKLFLKTLLMYQFENEPKFNPFSVYNCPL